MDSTAFRRLAVSGVACLVILPCSQTFSDNLRDEAVRYRTEGYQLQQQGDLDGALAAYEKAAALDPSYPTPYNDAGVLLEELGRLEDAKRFYEQALTVNPDYLQAHSNLAMLAEELGEKEQAVYHWLKRYQLGTPDDPWTIRAEARLVALGVLESHPGLKGKIYTRRYVVRQELSAHTQSRDEFRTATEQDGRW